MVLDGIDYFKTNPKKIQIQICICSIILFKWQIYFNDFKLERLVVWENFFIPIKRVHSSILCNILIRLK